MVRVAEKLGHDNLTVVAAIFEVFRWVLRFWRSYKWLLRFPAAMGAVVAEMTSSICWVLQLIVLGEKKMGGNDGNEREKSGCHRPASGCCRPARFGNPQTNSSHPSKWKHKTVDLSVDLSATNANA
ncbi:hypothetical protein Fot_12898 [Forsythia ovata]|uniref:Peroxisomal membrane protein PEX16 n=1 Tax=Forsythia ovata TaxID=205694 RepID=A0ABD1W5C9_9LAMI